MRSDFDPSASLGADLTALPVRDKITRLDAEVGIQTGRWWHHLKSVLLVCKGNTCRSPMAEAIGRRALGNTFCVQSAGDVSSFDVVVSMDPTIAESLRLRGTDPTKIIELNSPDPIGKEP